MSDMNQEIKEPLVSNDVLRNLSPLEHFFIGSSVMHEDRKVIDVKSLLSESRDGSKKATNELLRPISLQQGINGLEKVRQIRMKETEIKKLSGIVYPLDPERQLKLSEQDIHVWIEPSEVDDEGYVKPQWNLRLINGNKNLVKDPKLLNDLVLNQYYSNFFTLDQTDETTKEGYKILTLKNQPKKV